MKPIFELWVENLARCYAEGNLIGKWIFLPQDPQKLEEILQTILGESEKLSIGNFDISKQYNFYPKDFVATYSNISDLNAIAHLIEKTSVDTEVIDLYMLKHGNLTLYELGNLLMQLNEIPYNKYEFQGLEEYTELSAEEKYGYTKLNENGTYKRLEEMKLQDYVNYEKIGSDDSLSGMIALGDRGYLDTTITLDLKKYTWEEIYEEAGIGPRL